MAIILAGDIGGTKCHLALFDEKEPGKPISLETYASKDYDELTPLLQEYIRKRGEGREISACALALAGPVRDGKGHLTNLLWRVDARVLSSELGIDKVTLLNDIEASAWGIELLEPNDLYQLKWGADELRFGNRAILSPGTGLGEAAIIWDGKNYHPFPTEGGHVDFAPCDELQIELFNYLVPRFGHVSYERILSGPGIVMLFEFLHQAKKREVSPDILSEMKKTNSAEVISVHGLKGDSPICREVLTLFAHILGQELGNLALKFLAQGGLYLGGGIPKKIWPILREKELLMGFVNKGRFRSFLESIPIYIIMDDLVVIKGASRRA